MLSAKKYLKYIITSVSPLPFITGAAYEALAAAPPVAVHSTTNAGPNRTSDGQGFNDNIFNSGDSIILENDGDSISMDSNKDVAGIDLNAKDPTIGAINVTVSGAGLGSTGNEAADTYITLNVADGVELTLTGTATVDPGNGSVVEANIYSGLGNVTLGSTVAGAADTILNVAASGPVTFRNTFNTLNDTSGNWATLNISNADHIFNGAIGDVSKLGTVNIKTPNNITFNANVTAMNMILGNNTITVAGTDGITIDALIDGDDDNQGTLQITGDTAFPKAIGSEHSLNTINIAEDQTAVFNANVTATNMILANNSTAVPGNDEIMFDSLIDGDNYYHGTLQISKNISFVKKIGSVRPLNTINIAADKTVIFNADVSAQNIILDNNATALSDREGITIDALIDGDDYNHGNLYITGETTFTNPIGSEHYLNTINIVEDQTAFFEANVAATNIILGNNASASLRTDGIIIDALMDGTDDNCGRLVIAGDSTFIQAIGRNNPLGLISIFSDKTVVFNENVAAQSLTFYNNGTVIANEGAILKIDSIDGHSTLELHNQAPSGRIGSEVFLKTLRLVGWDGSENGIENEVHADILDLTEGTILKLTPRVDDLRIRNIVSSDDSSTGFEPGNSYAIFDIPRNPDLEATESDLVLENLGVATRILSNGQLRAYQAMPIGDNKIKINFKADGTFVLTGSGKIDAVTSSGGIGTFILSAGTAQNIEFTQAAGTYDAYLKSFKIYDAGSYNTSSKIVFSAKDIYAQEIIHGKVTIDARADGLSLHGDEITVDGTAYNIGTKTVTATDENARIKFIGDIVIGADYVNNDHIALDLSALDDDNINIEDLNSITYAVTGSAEPPPDAIMTMIATGKGVLPIPLEKIRTASSLSWRISHTHFGQLIFNPSPKVLERDNAARRAEINTGATIQDLEEGKLIVTTILGGKGIIESQNPENPEINLSLYDEKQYDYNFANFQDTQTFLDLIEDKIGVLAYIDEQILLTESSILKIEPEQAAAYAVLAKDQRLMPAILANAISNFKTSGIQEDIVKEAILLSANEGVKRVEEMVDRIEQSASQASSAVLNAVGARNTSVNLPTSTFAPPAAGSLSAEQGLGTAAGSGPYDKFGIWGSVNIGTAQQKQLKGANGFKSASQAILAGVDTMINEHTTVGFALSNSSNLLKHQNTGDGNKTDTAGWAGALYGNHNLKNNFFVRGTALFNKTHIHNKDRRVIVGGYGLAESKYNLISYGGEIQAGRYYSFSNDFIATPSVGLRVLHTNKIKYDEAGNTAQNNKNITQKAMENYSALAGLSIAKNILKNNITFTPEAHANFQYGINIKTPRGSFVSPLTPSQSTTFVGTKASKLTSACGLSLTGSGERVEFGINADVNLSDKYVGYQGGLKLKVKF